MSTFVFENEKIRVAVSEKTYAAYLEECRDRTEIMRSGDKRLHSKENEARGRILSDAMAKLVNDQEYLRVVANPPSQELDMEAARRWVRESYRDEYLQDNNRYGNELWLRLNGGHRMSTGMEELVSEANAYAAGKMGDYGMLEITNLVMSLVESSPTRSQESRALRKIRMMSSRNVAPSLETDLSNAALNIRDLRNYIHQCEVRYRGSFTNSGLAVEVKRSDLMPTQIGTCEYIAES